MKKNLLKNFLKRVTVTVVLFGLVTMTAFGTYYFVEKKVVYPLLYEREVLIYSDTFSLDPFLVFSVIKIESGFDENALSSKGAKGLMQIIEPTAKFIAEALNVKNYDLYDADTNIRFGCYYLRYLLDRFEIQNTALCAYNAGEGNISDWLSENSLSKDGKNIDYIPFKETREYIKKFEKTLLKYKKLYGKLLDKQKNIEYYNRATM